MPTVTDQQKPSSILELGRAAGAEIVCAERIGKVFRSGTSEISALDGVNLVVARGEMIAITGPSGSGKSTLLHILGALDTPTSGTVYFDGKMLFDLREHEIARVRGREIGFVWQRHHLLPDFTAAENVAMPLFLRGAALAEALGAAGRWLNEVGLGDRAESRTAELSGGEQQRVAIARALVSEPQLLLADEPTGDLDETNAEAVFDLMQRLHRTLRLTSIIATHNLSLARRADRKFILERGSLRAVQDLRAANPAGAALDTGDGETEEQVTRV
jgi:lipoprotein-releasing system ATP-binding protein